MKIKDLLLPPFVDWELEFYDLDDNFLISTYETNEDDEVWLDFLNHFEDEEILTISPAAVLGFMEVYTTIEG